MLPEIFLTEQVIDLTHTLSDKMSVYPGKTPLSRVICANYEAGYRLDDITLSCGIGTHVDAPNHFYQTGYGMEHIPLTSCFGSAFVIHLQQKVQETIDYAITVADILAWEEIHGILPVGAIVLFHTGWDRHWGTHRFCQLDSAGCCHFPGLSGEAAQLLLERKVTLVGIDTMGLDVGIHREFTAHKILLGANIPIVENLARLGDLPAVGAYVSLLPMKLEDASEAPIRAMAWIA